MSSKKPSSGSHGEQPRIPIKDQRRFERLIHDFQVGDTVLIETTTHPQNRLRIIDREIDEYNCVEYIAEGPKSGRYAIMPSSHPEKRRDGFTGPQMFHIGTTSGAPYDRKAEGAVIGLGVLAGTCADE